MTIKYNDKILWIYFKYTLKILCQGHYSKDFKGGGPSNGD